MFLSYRVRIHISPQTKQYKASSLYIVITHPNTYTIPFITMSTSSPAFQYTIDTVEYPPSEVRSKSVLGKYTILNDMASSETNGAYRSVVVLTETNQPVAFAPVRAISLDAFLEKHDITSDDVQITDIIEGTMMNLFYTSEGWEIATKSAIGGHYWYYRTQYGNSVVEPGQKTFRQMFLDAMRVDADTPLDEVPFIRELSKDYSYCFVVQHPANHIVLPIQEPTVWLVSMFRLASSEDADRPTEYRVCNIPQSAFKTLIPEFDAIGVVQLPQTRQYTLPTTADELRTAATFFHPQSLGYMISHTQTGERCALENPYYAHMRELRGNHPNLQYQYLVLLRMGKISEFLWHFSSYKPLFNLFYEQYTGFITAVHNAYVAYYIRKDKAEIPKKYFVHAARLHHDVYVPSLKTAEKIIIRRSVVRDYVGRLEPRELMYSLNDVSK